MKFVLLAVVILQASLQDVSSQNVLGCYWGSWSSTSQLTVESCTHAYFAFYDPTPSGTITIADSAKASYFTGLKAQYPSVKFMASVGGFNDASTYAFSTIANNPTLLATFVQNCVNLAVNSKYDGIDIDWEFPASSDKQAFVKLLSTLKPALNAKGKILTIAGSAGIWRIGESYDIINVCKNVDLMNCMTYDLQWPKTETGTNTGYSIVETAINTWITGGCQASKLVLGLASYGYIYSLTSANVQLKAPASGSNPITYPEICTKLKSSGWTTVIIDKTPVSYKGSEWISYDDVTSLKAKLALVTAKGLAGAFFWSTHQDDYSNVCGAGNFPLITAVSNALGIKSTTPVVATTTTTKAAGVTTTATTTKAPSTTVSCASGDGFYAYPGDCTRYYRCVSGTISYFTCPAGLGWVQSAQTCNWKSQIPGCV